MTKRIAFLIVAAGASRRLGRPKQLIELESGLPILQKLIDIVSSFQMLDIVVVLGANAEEIRKKINLEGVRCVYNPHWQQGMGSSISTGVKSIENSAYSGVVVSVVDQPFLSRDIIKKIIEKVVGGKKQVVLSQFQEGSGPPVFFSEHFFSELKKLNDDSGAKTIVMRNFNFVEKTPFELGHIDIDSKEDIITYKNIK